MSRPSVPDRSSAPGWPSVPTDPSAPGSHLARAIAAAVVVTLIVAACGSGTATPATPSVSDIAASLPTPILVTAAPTPVLVTPPPVEIHISSRPSTQPSGSPGANPSPTTAPTPRPTPTRDLVLEATLPSEFEGMAIDRTSYVLSDAVAAAQGANFKPIVDLIASLGLKPEAFSQAAGQPADRSKGYGFIAYRFAGATEPDILPALLAALTDAGVADTTGSAEVGGRRVRTITSGAFTGPLQGATEYVYQVGDTVYGVIATDEALAGRMLAVLP